MFRLLFAIVVISLSGCLPLEYWPAQALMMVVFWGAAAVQGARLDQMLRRLAVFMPFVAAVVIGVPLTQDGGWDWTWSLTILCRALVAFFGGVWLVQVLPFVELQVALRQLRVPDLFL